MFRERNIFWSARQNAVRRLPWQDTDDTHCTPQFCKYNCQFILSVAVQPGQYNEKEKVRFILQVYELSQGFRVGCNAPDIFFRGCREKLYNMLPSNRVGFRRHGDKSMVTNGCCGSPGRLEDAPPINVDKSTSTQLRSANYYVSSISHNTKPLHTCRKCKHFF